jgi:hypothetical protein
MPAGRFVGVGDGCPVAGNVAIGVVAVGDVVAEQAPSVNSRQLTRNVNSSCFGFR